MRFLVTGATGHLGSFLTRSLVHQGHDVAVFIRPNSDIWRIQEIIHRVRTINGDLSQIEQRTPDIVEFAPDIVFHLGWYGVTSEFRDDPRQITENLNGSLRLLEAAHDAGSKCWIGIGSQAEYGPVDGILNEQTPLRPTTAYGKTKLSIGLLTQELCRAYGIRHVWLRLLATYGPMDDGRRLIPSVINQLLAGQKPALTPGEQCWDYLHVEDFIAALQAVALNDSTQGTFVIGSGTAHPLRKIVERIRDLIDPKLPLGWGELPYRANQIMHLEADPGLLQRATDWHPKITLEQGLATTVDWHRKQFPLPKASFRTH